MKHHEYADAFLSKVENSEDQIIYVDNELGFQKSVILSGLQRTTSSRPSAHTLLFKLIKQNRVRPVPRNSNQAIANVIMVKIAVKTHDFTHIPE